MWEQESSLETCRNLLTCSVRRFMICLIANFYSSASPLLHVFHQPSGKWSMVDLKGSALITSGVSLSGNATSLVKTVHPAICCSFLHSKYCPSFLPPPIGIAVNKLNVDSSCQLMTIRIVHPQFIHCGLWANCLHVGLILHMCVIAASIFCFL